jgi:hypothetical protein
LSFSEDQASPTTPFRGDETGEVFDAPDLVLQSPTTQERVVDTQSGFLVVVRRADSRIALSVKRRLGTPPTSSLVLTPDESLKLSKILNSSESPVALSPQFRAANVAEHIEDCLASLPESESDRQLSQLYESDSGASNGASKDGESKSARIARTDWSKLVDSSNSVSVLKSRKVMALAGIALLAAVATVALATHKWQKREVSQKLVALAPINQQMEEEKHLDAFVRNYVGNMLDFSPATYRYSQIQAMASMTPNLQEKYWQETHFPIAGSQLKAAARRQTLLITKVTQQVQPNLPQRVVDVFAELNNPNSKVIAPIHLELTVETQASGQMQVLAQKDITSLAK